MEDNNDAPVMVVKEDPIEQWGERVIKKTLPDLVRTNQHINKELFINVIQQFVINNSEIAVRLGIIMHHIVMRCVDENRDLPQNFCAHDFIEKASNWQGWKTQPYALVLNAIARYGDFIPSYNNLQGKSWLLGYLQNMYHGNIIASTKGKWRAVINDSIDAHARIHLQDAPDQVVVRTKYEIRRQILSPASARPNTAPNLDQTSLELVGFHRQGFRCEGNLPLTDFYIENNEDLYRHFILHYGHCLRRQENLENEWNNNHHPTDRIGLKKRIPLPFFNNGSRKSLQIDKKGLYWILSEYERAGGNLL